LYRRAISAPDFRPLRDVRAAFLSEAAWRAFEQIVRASGVTRATNFTRSHATAPHNRRRSFPHVFKKGK
jgi:hypothetical protein